MKLMDDDLKSASDSLHQPSEQPAYRPSPTKNRRSFPKKTFISIAILIVVAGVGFAAKKFIHIPKKTAPAQTAVTQAVPKTTGDDVPDVPASETYSSTALSVGFKYPKTWKTSEADGGIRIDSPQFTYPAANLGSVDGIFRIYIRQGARKADSRYVGAGTAIKPSEKLVYTKPAVGQRSDTLLSSFGNNSTDIFTYFLIAGNFQLAKGDTLGPNYGTEPDTYIVAGGYTSITAVDDLAMNSVALTYYDKTTAYKQAYGIISSLQLK